MRAKRSKRLLLLAVSTALLAALVGSPWLVPVKGADHREAPLISEDGPGDIADVYAFVNPNDPAKVVFAITVNGFSVPAVRGSYAFGPDVLYQIKIDNNGDGREDLVLQARFEGYETVRDARCPAVAAGPQAGQGGQFVTVRGPAPPALTGALNNDLGADAPVLTGCTNLILGPSAAGVRAFAGLRDDPFVVDVGQLNRILGDAQEVFRGFTSPVLGDLRGRSVRPDGTSGVDSFGGFNASALVFEVPKALVQGTAARTASYLLNNETIGVWGTTSRHRLKRLFAENDPAEGGVFAQIQRMGHQVIKTVFIPSASRNAYNRSIPEEDIANWSQFFPDALTTTDTDGTGNTIAGRATVLGLVGVTALPTGVPLLLGAGFGNTDPDLIRHVLLPDVLRLNLAIAPNDLAIGANGLQNGRRLGDDVIDILLRIARELADVKFPDTAGIPGSGPLGSRRALNCTLLPACEDRRVLAVLQGTDFIKPDGSLGDLSTSGNDRALLGDFPFFAASHPLPGGAGTVGFPAQQ